MLGFSIQVYFYYTDNVFGIIVIDPSKKNNLLAIRYFSHGIVQWFKTWLYFSTVIIPYSLKISPILLAEK